MNIKKNIVLGESTLNDIYINNLAYQLESENPHLSFFEINNLVKQTLEDKKPSEIIPHLKIVPLDNNI